MNKFELYINQTPIEMVDFLLKNRSIIINSLFAGENQRSLILHPGSNILSIQSIVCYAFFSFIKANSQNEDWLYSLLPQDIVINAIDNRRYEVLNIDENYIRLRGSNKLTYTLPVNNTTANKLKQYRGKATSLDGRGIRKKIISEKDIFASIFSIEEQTIKSAINTSFVVICKKQEADFIMSSTSIKIKGGQYIELGDLFPAAYYTSSSDWVNYSGNSAKVEPVIKFTNKISVARELILEDEEEKIFGVITCGSEYLLCGISELNDLLVRQSLPNVTMLASITYGDYSDILTKYEEIKLYAWTCEALLSTIEDLSNISSSQIGAEVAMLYKLIDNFCENDLNYSIIEPNFDMELPAKCRLALQKLKNNLPESEDKDSFIIYGFSLLKLIEYSCFPLIVMERLIDEKSINAISPNDIYEKLNCIAQTLKMQSISNYDDIKFVMDILLSMLNSITYNNPKKDFLERKILEFCSENENRIAVIIPKDYYGKAIFECLNGQVKNSLLHYCDISSPKGYDRKKLYKKVFVLGLSGTLDFNALTLSNTESVNIIHYPFEKWRVDLLNFRTKSLMEFYDKYNNIEYEYLGLENKLKEDFCINNEIENELEAVIDNTITRMSVRALEKVSQNVGQTTEVDTFISFETGECVFFTKHYSPYVYNSIDETVEETDIRLIKPGDILVFTSIDNTNNDIVDRVLSLLVNLNHINDDQKEAYRKSKHWKNALKMYMDTNDYSYAHVAKQLRDLGRGKHVVTIRNWLNEDSRIIGPRDSDSFYSIALITNDNEMLEDPDGFCDACREVRSLRIRILKYIGKLIMRSISGKVDDPFEERLAFIAGDIRQMAKLLQVERVEKVDTVVPVYLANRIQLID